MPTTDCGVSNETAHYHDQPTLVAAPYSAQVAQIQTRLVQLGYLAGPPDGAWGPKSRKALRAFKAGD
jgi:peptidoglycan hydrolase-like protein with peptidoglycan-binding domain